MNSGLLQGAIAFLEKGEDFVWVTILDTNGSSPRHAGSGMLVGSGGSVTGSVGGGPLEAAVIAEAGRALCVREPRLLEYKLDAADSPEPGMMCGGSGSVLVDYVPAADSQAQQFFEQVAGFLREGCRGWLVTELSGSEAGGWTVARRLVSSAGAMPADLEGAPGSADGGSSPGECVITHREPIGFDGTAYVFGAGHCGEKLVPILGIAGFATVVLDDRAEFANRDRFPTADKVVVLDSFEGALENLPVGSDSYVVIVTRGHTYDASVLAQALMTAAYIGMMGSKKKVATIFEALRDNGFSSADMARVRAPIGLPIGAETPGEIAVAIAAQLVQVRAEVRRRGA